MRRAQKCSSEAFMTFKCGVELLHRNVWNFQKRVQKQKKGLGVTLDPLNHLIPSEVDDEAI